MSGWPPTRKSFFCVKGGDRLMCPAFLRRRTWTASLDGFRVLSFLVLQRHVGNQGMS